jgi:hypothetical protein
MTYEPRLKLYAHQRDAVNKMKGRKAFALLMAMRTGKTATLLCDFGQLEDDGEVQDLLVIAPAGVYATWMTAINEHVGDSLRGRLLVHKWSASATKAEQRDLHWFMNEQSRPRVLLVNVEALSSVKRAKDLCTDFLAQRASMCAIDECFAAGTRISVPGGTRNIESLRPGDEVLTSNGITKVKRLIEKHTQTIVRLALSNGEEIWCTPNHPFMTEQGWMCAGHLAGRRLLDEKEIVRLVQEGRSEKPEEQILQHILLSEMAHAPARDQSSHLYRGALQANVGCIEGERDGHPILEQRHSDEGELAYKIEQFAEGHGLETSSDRGQRSWIDKASGGFADEIGIFLEAGGRHRIGREASRLSNMLQSGSWQREIEMGDRVRWEQSQQQICQGETSEESREVGGVWVESVEVAKFKSSRTVFDLELEGAPHFFAEGVLCHNSTVIKNPTSQRTKFINGTLAPLAKYRRILTGMISPNSPLDVYGQFQFLGPKLLGFSSYYAFRARYAVMKKLPVGGRQIPIVVSYRDIDELRTRIEPHSHRVRLEDCYDMKEPTYAIRHVELTDEQKRVYQELKHFASAQLGDEFVSAQQVITQILRMHQVLCGHTRTEGGDFRELSENRTDALLELLAEYEGKAIIWCSYDHDIRKVAAALTKEYGQGSVARFWGGNQSTREDEEKMFLHSPDCRFIIATAAAGGRGRTWMCADLVVYYSNTHDLEHRAQSEERPKGVGKDRPIHYVDLMVPGTVDEKIITALRNKINIASTISGDAYKDWLI